MMNYFDNTLSSGATSSRGKHVPDMSCECSRQRRRLVTVECKRDPYARQFGEPLLRRHGSVKLSLARASSANPLPRPRGIRFFRADVSLGPRRRHCAAQNRVDRPCHSFSSFSMARDELLARCVDVRILLRRHLAYHPRSGPLGIGWIVHRVVIPLALLDSLGGDVHQKQVDRPCGCSTVDSRPRKRAEEGLHEAQCVRPRDHPPKCELRKTRARKQHVQIR